MQRPAMPVFFWLGKLGINSAGLVKSKFIVFHLRTGFRLWNAGGLTIPAPEGKTEVLGSWLLPPQQVAQVKRDDMEKTREADNCSLEKRLNGSSFLGTLVAACLPTGWFVSPSNAQTKSQFVANRFVFETMFSLITDNKLLVSHSDVSEVATIKIQRQVCLFEFVRFWPRLFGDLLGWHWSRSARASMLKGDAIRNVRTDRWLKRWRRPSRDEFEKMVAAFGSGNLWVGLYEPNGNWQRRPPFSYAYSCLIWWTGMFDDPVRQSFVRSWFCSSSPLVLLHWRFIVAVALRLNRP